jgi:hypothetical protein
MHLSGETEKTKGDESQAQAYWNRRLYREGLGTVKGRQVIDPKRRKKKR